MRRLPRNRVGLRLLGMLLATACSAGSVAGWSQETAPPVRYHVSFDSRRFLADDFSATFQRLSPEQRGLTLVPGVFGRALQCGFRFQARDFERIFMSLRDLDPLLQVVAHYRFRLYEKYAVGGMQPYYWGTGRLATDGGTVAFWARGERVPPGQLFFQGSSSFGRHEKYLLGIDLAGDRSLSAYLVDARYRQHRIRTQPALWDGERFNHVALAWDRAEGLKLFLNGSVVASNWGRDAWWTTQMPGLFFMPMAGFSWDELWVFDRPLLAREVTDLMRGNSPPAGPPKPPKRDDRAAARLAESFIGAGGHLLPALDLRAAGRISFQEIVPLRAGDGIVKAPQVMDGKYELAWPQNYTAFTNILGDSDFHATKVDFTLPAGRNVNYVTLEGNLTGARVLVPTDGQGAGMMKILDVPAGTQMFHGQEIVPCPSRRFRIPFLKDHGSPAGYAPGLRLARTGAIRIHEVAFYHVGPAEDLPRGVRPQVFHVALEGETLADRRFGYAMRALNDWRSRCVVALRNPPDRGATVEPSRWVEQARFDRLNLLSTPVGTAKALKAVDLDLRVRDLQEGDFIILRLHDPAVPGRIWNKLVFRVKNTVPGANTVRLRLDPLDIRMAATDRVWIDLAWNRDTALQTGAASTVTLWTAPLAGADPRYATKALQPAFGAYAKLYYWYFPWLHSTLRPSSDAVVTFGGFYDAVTYPLMVLRTQPDEFFASTLLKLTLFEEKGLEGGYTFPAWESDSRYWPPLTIAKADDSPDWAFAMHAYLAGFQAIVHWWADRQNADGQVGGGWNDDVLFAARLAGPFLYLGDAKARTMFDRIFAGLDKTHMFHDGYCNVVPMDSLHVDDFVRNRFEGLFFDLGNPRKMATAMRTAWHLGKPERTPANYLDGSSFRYDADLIRWYWGETKPAPVYALAKEALTRRIQELAPAMNPVIRFRYTEAGAFTDSATLPGAVDVKRFVTGGSWGTSASSSGIAVSWEDPHGVSVPRWVEKASDTELVAHFYSYASRPCDVTARLLRIGKGVYQVTLSGEGKDTARGDVVTGEQTLRRFDKIRVPVRPGRALVLRVKRIQELADPARKPDLAVDVVGIKDGSITARVLNFGNAEARSIVVRLQNARGRVLAEQSIERLKSACDFVPGVRVCTLAAGRETCGSCRIVVDPENRIEEICEENNAAAIE